MALQHGKKYYLLFPLADGNLVDLWKQVKISPSTPQHVRWILGQCRGIASGLRKVHNHNSWYNYENSANQSMQHDDERNKGRHGDIKPQNILCFPRAGGTYRLVISDFGLTRFHSANSVSQVAHERVGGFSQTYRPPEYDMKFTISRAYDMWSLGCLFLEFISWFLLGWEEHELFAKARVKDDRDSPIGEDKFFNIIQGKPVVKQSVKDVS